MGYSVEKKMDYREILKLWIKKCNRCKIVDQRLVYKYTHIIHTYSLSYTYYSYVYSKVNWNCNTNSWTAFILKAHYRKMEQNQDLTVFKINHSCYLEKLHVKSCWIKDVKQHLMWE